MHKKGEWMIKDIKQMELELDADIPRDVVSQRDGGGGRKLSYLEGWYVIDRLNKIFGPLNWAKEVLDVRQVVNTTSKGEFPAYLVKVRLSILLTDAKGTQSVVVKEAYGYGADKSSQNAHELAIKEAVTDGLKVAAKDLGMSMGLALYDKTQERVSYGLEQMEVILSLRPESKPSVVGSKEELSTAIKSYFKVAEAQKRLTKDTFRSTILALHNVEKVDELSETDMSTVLNKLKELTK